MIKRQPKGRVVLLLGVVLKLFHILIVEYFILLMAEYKQYSTIYFKFHPQFSAKIS